MISEARLYARNQFLLVEVAVDLQSISSYREESKAEALDAHVSNLTGQKTEKERTGGLYRVGHPVDAISRCTQDNDREHNLGNADKGYPARELEHMRAVHLFFFWHNTRIK